MSPRGQQLLHEPVVDRRLEQEAGARDADLAGIAEDAVRRDLRRVRDVGDVVENDVWRLAAQLQMYALEVGSCGVVEQTPADGARSGERNSVHVHVKAERLAGRLAAARHDVEDPVGHTRLGSQFGQPQQRERRDLRRLEDDRVAGGKGRGDLPGADHHREIPGDDDTDDAERFAVDQAEDVVGSRGDFAVDLVDCLGIVAEGARGRERLGLVSHGNLGAVVADPEHGQFGGVPLDQVRQGEQRLLALRRRPPRPDARLEGGPRRRHRAVDIRRIAVGDRRERLAVDRRGHLQRPLAGCRRVAAGDEERLWRDGLDTEPIYRRLVKHGQFSLFRAVHWRGQGVAVSGPASRRLFLCRRACTSDQKWATSTKTMTPKMVAAMGRLMKSSGVSIRGRDDRNFVSMM